MCDLVTGLMVASTVVSAGSQVAAGSAAASAGSFQQGEYENQRTAALNRATRDSRIRLSEFRDQESANIAAAAFSGLSLDSFDHVFQANRRRAGNDIAEIESQGAGSAASARAQGQAARQRGRQARFQGIVNAGATLIGGAQTFAMNARPTLVKFNTPGKP